MNNSEKPKTSASAAVDYISSGIVSGKFQSGSRLPPVRELAKLVGVSNYPIQAAIAQLSKEGVVEAVRGSGVYVAKDALYKLLGSSAMQNSKKKIAVLSAFYAFEGSLAVEHGATVLGFLRECSESSLRPLLISPFMNLENSNLVVEEIKDGSFDAVLWLYPPNKHFASIKALSKADIPIVITSHEPLDLDFPTVEENIYAVSRKVKEYLKTNGCRKIIYFVLPNAKMSMEGISTVYQNDFIIEEVKVPYSGDYYRKQLRDYLTAKETDSSVFIPNNRDLRAFFSDCPEELVALLSRHKVVISTDESVYDNLLPLLERVDALVILHRFQSIGKLAAQKLSVVLSGKLEKTTTLVPLEVIEHKNAR